MCELLSAIHPLIGRGVHVHEIHSLLDSKRAHEVMAKGQMQLKIFESISKDSVDLPMLKGTSRELQDLMKATLMRDPSLRPSSGKILSHPWFRVHDIDSLKKAVDVVRRFAKSNSRYLNMETEMLKQVESEKSRLSFALKKGDISKEKMNKKLRDFKIYQTVRIRNAGLCPVGLLHDAMTKAEAKKSIREI
jgi:serine/threonine protein kinase